MSREISGKYRSSNKRREYHITRSVRVRGETQKKKRKLSTAADNDRWWRTAVEQLNSWGPVRDEHTRQARQRNKRKTLTVLQLHRRYYIVHIPRGSGASGSQNRCARVDGIYFICIAADTVTTAAAAAGQ